MLKVQLFLDGNLTVGNLTIEVVRIRIDSIKISWNRIEEAHSYIVFLRNLETAGETKTVSVNAALNTYTFRELTSGTQYEIGGKN